MQRQSYLSLECLLLVLVSGCAAGYDTGKPSPQPLPIAAARVAIDVPADGRDERPETYVGSGKQTADALTTVLAKRGLTTGVGGASQFNFSRPASPSYRVTPTIESWVDRVTEWSGKPDQLQIHLVVTDVNSGKIVDDRTIHASSKWMTFGGDHPQQMLQDLFAKWADMVFARPAKA